MTEEWNGEEIDLLAAEYALGLLSGDTLAEARRREMTDPGFALLVDRWNERFEPLIGEIEPVQPDGNLWDRIRSSIEAPEQRPVELDSMRRRLNIWKGYSAAITAVAAALLLVVGLRTAEPPQPVPAPATAPAAGPMMVATLAPETGPPSLTATYDPATQLLVVAPAVLGSVQGHDHELWIVPEGGTPHSLGIVTPAAPRRMRVPPAMDETLMASATIALSAEPSGGSPTGLPTGPIVASGKFARI